jgi:hypothetical protein
MIPVGIRQDRSMVLRAQVSLHPFTAGRTARKMYSPAQLEPTKEIALIAGSSGRKSTVLAARGQL